MSSILTKEMVILIFIHDQRNFGGSARAAQFKSTGFDRRIVCDESRNHIRTRLGVCIIEPRIPANTSRLVEREVAHGIRETVLDLLGILDVHRVHETVVSRADFAAVIPSLRLVFGFGAAQRCFARAGLEVFEAECFSRKRSGGAGGEALATRLSPRHWDWFAVE